jgi:protein SCO1/2
MLNGLKWLLAAGLLAGCGTSAPEAPPLAGARIGGPFAAMAEDGRSVTDKDFAGKYRLVYFGYSYCPDVCPVDVRNLMLGLKAFENADAAAAAQLQPLFFTVDPERDTPKVLAEFTDAFHPRLIGLTGSPEQVAATAKTFAVAYQKGEAKTPGAYLVDHSRIAMLFGKNGEPIAIVSHDAKPEQIAEELAKWVK